ncbi:MAG: BON domain-containing protein [Cellvibrionaceae bacterium]
MMTKKLTILSIGLLCILLNGCSTVINATTSEPIDMDPNRRTMGTAIDDSQIETIANVNLKKAHPDIKSAPITVTSYNRVVLLTGQIRNNELRQLAAKTVSKLSKVRQVHNELQVQAPISFFATIGDAWITSKLKTKLLANKEIRSNRLKIITENGTVHFMGLLGRAEAERASDIARTTSGVQKVVLAIEYLD